MNYAAIKNCDIANGPGVRVSLFVSGCRHHCKDCFNPETWDFACGEPFDEAVMDKLLALLAPGYIRGITYLGGEPFEPENQPGLLELSRRIRAAYPEKSIWSFTGYLFDRDILAKKLGPWEVTQELLSYLDVLVDGPFVASLKNLNLRFRGSSNQRLIDVPASLKPEPSSSGTSGSRRKSMPVIKIHYFSDDLPRLQKPARATGSICTAHRPCRFTRGSMPLSRWVCRCSCRRGTRRALRRARPRSSVGAFCRPTPSA